MSSLPHAIAFIIVPLLIVVPLLVPCERLQCYRWSKRQPSARPSTLPLSTRDANALILLLLRVMQDSGLVRESLQRCHWSSCRSSACPSASPPSMQDTNTPSFSFLSHARRRNSSRAPTTLSPKQPLIECTSVGVASVHTRSSLVIPSHHNTLPLLVVARAR